MNGRPHHKPYAQSKIGKLEPEQRKQVHKWFRENLTYSEMQKRFQSEFGITISAASLSEYYSRHGLEFLGPRTESKERPISVEVVLHIQIRPEIRWIKPASSEQADS